MQEKQTKFDYKWVIMAISFLMVFTALGFCSSNKDLFLKPITQALSLDRAGFSLSDSCRYITTAIVNLFFSALVIRWGAKRMAAYGFAALTAFCLIYSFAEEYWQFYIGGAFLGLGLAWCTTTVVGYVVTHWFTENRGTIMGIILAANGLGAAVFAPIVRPIITAEPFGYRTAYRLGAVLMVVMLVLIVLFFHNSPKGTEIQHPSKHKKPSRGESWVGMDFSHALKRPYFYFAAICVFFTGAALQAISGIRSAHLSDVGLEHVVTMTASFYAICLAGSKILAGVSFDHLGLRVTMLICNAAAAVAIYMLAVLNAGTNIVLVFVCMLLLALSMPLETIMLPLIVADMFGEKSFAKTMGLFVSINTAGYALGAPMMNFVWDKVGSYKPILLVMAGMLAVITVGFQVILHFSGKDRKRILAREAAKTEN